MQTVDQEDAASCMLNALVRTDYRHVVVPCADKGTPMVVFLHEPCGESTRDPVEHDRTCPQASCEFTAVEVDAISHVLELAFV